MQKLSGLEEGANEGQLLIREAALDVDLFRRALAAAVAEADGLAMRISLWNGRLVQRMGAPPAPTFDEIDLSQAGDPRATVMARFHDLLAEPIDVDATPPFKFALFRLAETRYAWARVFNHAFIDHPGATALTRRVNLHMRALAASAPPPPPPASFGECAARFYEAASGERAAAARAYWSARLASPPPLIWPFLATRRRARVRTERVVLDSDWAPGFGPTPGQSWSNIFLSRFAKVLAEQAPRGRLILGVQVDLRGGARFQDTIGCFATPIPLVIDANTARGDRDPIERLAAQLAASYRHARFPIRELRLRDEGLPPFDAIFNFLPGHDTHPWREIEVDHGASATLVLTVARRERSWEFRLDHDTRAVTREAAGTMLARIVDAAPASDRRRVDAKATRLPLGQGEVRDLPVGATLMTLIDEAASRAPDAVALEDEHESLTYRETIAQADVIADSLAQWGVVRGDIVGLRLRRGVGMVVAILALHRLGAAFMPIDPAHPAERAEIILTQARAKCVLATETFETRTPCISLDQLVTAAGPSAPRDPAQASDIAYVIHTSGSTGQPKGVAVEHRSVVNFVLWGARTLGREALEGMLFSTSLVFDVAIFELFTPLSTGGRVLIVDRLGGHIPERFRDNVRVVSGAPTVLAAMLRSTGFPPFTRLVVAAGEALSRDLADKILAAPPGPRLINAYGPTEATVYASYSEIKAGDRDAPPIGLPLSNMTLHVLDPEGGVAGIGVEGELHLGGLGLARGYLHREDLTRERFIKGLGELGRLYRTGDRARWRPDGRLEYLGRIDDQLKLKGVRVERAEITEALLRQPGVAAAAVDVVGQGEARRLAAWIVPEGEPPKARALRRGLAQLLPRAIIPSAYAFVGEFPVTSSGKLNYSALPAISHSTPGDAKDRRAPSTEAEKAILAICEAAVTVAMGNVATLGLDEDLFDAGLDSLGAFRVLMDIESQCAIRIGGDSLDGDFSVSGLAALAEIARGQARRADAVPPTPLVLFHRERFARGPRKGVALGMPSYLGDVGTISIIGSHALDDYEVWSCSLASGGADLRVDELWLRCAKEIAARMDAELGCEPAVFFGFSFGGFMGWIVDRLSVAQGRRATPIVNFDGYAAHVVNEGWISLAAAASTHFTPHIPAHMLLLHRATPRHFHLPYRPDRDWSAAGVIVKALRFQTLDHLDFISPALIEAAGGAISAFIEGRAAPLRYRQDWDTRGGRIFRLADAATSPSAAEVGDLVLSVGVPEDDYCRDALMAIIERVDDPTLSLDFARRLVAAQSIHARFHLALAHAWLASGDRGAAAAAYREALRLDPNLPTHLEGLQLPRAFERTEG